VNAGWSFDAVLAADPAGCCAAAIPDAATSDIVNSEVRLDQNALDTVLRGPWWIQPSMMATGAENRNTMPSPGR
jgi:hypothetical protein